MKKISFVLTCLFFLSFLAGCCSHEWEDATCENPTKCTKCEETEGEALGHDFVDATCTKPKTCTRCQLTEGESLGHSYTDATCESPQVCSRCYTARGEALGHSTGLGKCKTCGTKVTKLVDEALVIVNYCIDGIEYMNKASQYATAGASYGGVSVSQMSISYLTQSLMYFQYALTDSISHPTEFQKITDLITGIVDAFDEENTDKSSYGYFKWFTSCYSEIGDEIAELNSFLDYIDELTE